MKIIVKAKASAKTTSVELLTPQTLNFGNERQQANIYKVSVKEPPINGRSNQAITKALAEYFHVPLSSVKLISGRASKQKIFEIIE